MEIPELPIWEEKLQEVPVVIGSVSGLLGRMAKWKGG